MAAGGVALALMRNVWRAVGLVLMLLLVAVCAAWVALRTSSDPEPAAGNLATTGGDEGGGLRAEADEPPELGGLVIGLLLVAALALVFASYVRRG